MAMPPSNMEPFPLPCYLFTSLSSFKCSTFKGLVYQFQMPPNSEVMASGNRFDMSGSAKSALPESPGKASAGLSFTPQHSSIHIH